MIEEIEHTADYALHIQGRNLADLFLKAASGMNALLVDDPARISLTVTQQVELEASDAESLLVDWLSELAYWAEIESVVFREFELSSLSPTALKAVLQGGKVPNLMKHIKAVTYHNLEIVKTKDGMAVTIVFDV